MLIYQRVILMDVELQVGTAKDPSPPNAPADTSPWYPVALADWLGPCPELLAAPFDT